MSTPLRGVLLVTHSADHFTVDRVQAGIVQRGRQPIRLDTDRFPADLQLTTRAGPAELSLRMRIADGEQLTDVPIDAIGAVWMRRIFGPPRPTGLDDMVADQCVRESRAALEGFLSALGGA